MARLEALEKQKEETKYQSERMKAASGQIKVTQTEMKRVFAQIRKLIKLGDSSNLGQLIDLHVDKIGVYPKQVVVKLNFFSSSSGYGKRELRRICGKTGAKNNRRHPCRAVFCS